MLFLLLLAAVNNIETGPCGWFIDYTPEVYTDLIILYNAVLGNEHIPNAFLKEQGHSLLGQM